MKTIITGIQSSGRPHIGNIYGAINPIINFNKSENRTIAFIADIHSLTTIKDAGVRVNNTYSILASLLALGFDFEKNILFKQSDVSKVCELSFHLSCFTPYPMLANSHSFKEKSDNLSDVNVGLFFYPALMAADILLYDADLVPVGKDQKQHLEITRDIASKFNNQYGNIFKLPSSYMMEDTMIVPGIDGRKMSKSYNNYIDPFEEENKIKKCVFKIVTDSKGANDIKDPNSCNIYNIYSVIATDGEKEEMKAKYLNGSMSYGNAKSILFDSIINKFDNARKEYNKIINDKTYLDSILKIGAEKASEIADRKMNDIKRILGL